MLKIRQAELFGHVKGNLSKLQAEIAILPVFPDQVREAAAMWEKKSRVLFADVRELLDTLCTGARRCNYCEDSVADEIEHTYPKKFYPERTFVWSNYLFACGPCNGSNKGDKFAVFSAIGDVMHVKRGKTDPVTPPVAGDVVFIDPRVDDPFAMMEFDPDTGLFVPIGSSGDRNYKRAEYTIEILGLNKRDYLSRARRNAYSTYVNSIEAYIRAKAGASNAELRKRKQDINNGAHQSVFAEIGRLSSLNILHGEFWTQGRELWDAYEPF